MVRRVLFLDTGTDGDRQACTAVYPKQLSKRGSIMIYNTTRLGRVHIADWGSCCPKTDLHTLECTKLAVRLICEHDMQKVPQAGGKLKTLDSNHSNQNWALERESPIGSTAVLPKTHNRKQREGQGRGPGRLPHRT